MTTLSNRTTTSSNTVAAVAAIAAIVCALAAPARADSALAKSVAKRDEAAAALRRARAASRRNADALIGALHAAAGMLTHLTDGRTVGFLHEVGVRPEAASVSGDNNISVAAEREAAIAATVALRQKMWDLAADISANKDHADARRWRDWTEELSECRRDMTALGVTIRRTLRQAINRAAQQVDRLAREHAQTVGEADTKLEARERVQVDAEKDEERLRRELDAIKKEWNSKNDELKKLVATTPRSAAERERKEDRYGTLGRELDALDVKLAEKEREVTAAKERAKGARDRHDALRNFSVDEGKSNRDFRQVAAEWRAERL